MLKRYGYPFVATPAAVAAMDMHAGPTEAIVLADGRRLAAPASNKSLPHTYEPSFFEAMLSVFEPPSGLEVARETRDAVVYRFPTAAIATLAELIPDRADYTLSVIEGLAHKLMRKEEVKAKFLLGGVTTALLMVRGFALKATAQSERKDVYYWFHR
jgi:hypothetical protein